LGLALFGACSVGVLVGWFVASLMICGKIADLERECYILRRELGICL